MFLTISSQSMKTRHKKMARLAKGRILDVGYAQHPNVYLRGEVIGYDIEKLDRLPANYNRMIKDDFKNVEKHFEPKSFDTIVAGEFIEHIDCHISFFKKCHTFLRKDGLLVLTTPTPYYYKTIFGNIFLLKGRSLIKDHVSIYIPRILNNIAEGSGFKVVSVGAATRFYIPFLTWQLIYVYRKV